MKKVILTIFLISLASFEMFSCASASDYVTALKEFKAENAKIREMRQSGASQQEISIQENKVKMLRKKVNELQAQQDSFTNVGN